MEYSTVFLAEQNRKGKGKTGKTAIGIGQQPVQSVPQDTDCKAVPNHAGQQQQTRASDYHHQFLFTMHLLVDKNQGRYHKSKTDCHINQMFPSEYFRHTSPPHLSMFTTIRGTFFPLALVSPDHHAPSYHTATVAITLDKLYKLYCIHTSFVKSKKMQYLCNHTYPCSPRTLTSPLVRLSRLPSMKRTTSPKSSSISSAMPVRSIPSRTKRISFPAIIHSFRYADR